ncbi:MAG: beta-propeller fold lactonase family protein, partial [Synergistaceae bacterium]|nr:beta-propeller fold lactonase family protein [Synergistaceae bacterium]
VMQDNTGKFLIVSCQGRKAGYGQVDVFRIDGGNGTLEKTCAVKSREIAEPRHVAFHANNKYCYGVNEKDYSVTFYDFDQNNGTLTPRQILPTLPETYTGDGWASGIIMSKDCRNVIVSNRKHDSITSFAVNPDNGMLKFADCIKTGGGQPRFITLDPKGRILAANETTDTLTFFTIDEAGKFSASGKTIETESPVCVIFG